MQAVTITIDVDALDFGTTYDADDNAIARRSLPEAVISEGARVLLAQIETEQKREIRQTVTRIVNETVKEAVGPMILAALAEPFRSTNGYGEATGQTTTLREVIVKEAQAFMSKPADNYSRNNGTVLQKFVRDEVAAAMKAELKEALDAEKTQAAAALRKAASEMLTKTIVTAAKAVA